MPRSPWCLRNSGRFHPVRADAARRCAIPPSYAAGRALGLAAIIAYKLAFAGFKSGPGFRTPSFCSGGYDWGYLAYAVGFGGSMLWFGSSAGVALTNLHPQAKSVGRWIRHGWPVIAGYVIGFMVMLALLGWHSRRAAVTLGPPGTRPRCARYHRPAQKPELAMRVITTISTASAALALIASAAFAQDAKTGMITQIDRLNSTIAIQQTQDGTVGAGSSGGAVKQYKVQGASLDAVHAGDQVSFTATQSGGVDTITKIEKKKR